MAHLYAMDGRLNESERACRKSLEIFKKNFGSESPELEDAQNMLEVILREKERRHAAADPSQTTDRSAPLPTHLSATAKRIRARQAASRASWLPLSTTAKLAVGGAAVVGALVLVGILVRTALVQRKQ
jgi:hypothetical protein